MSLIAPSQKKILAMPSGRPRVWLALVLGFVGSIALVGIFISLVCCFTQALVYPVKWSSKHEACWSDRSKELCEELILTLGVQHE